MMPEHKESPWISLGDALRAQPASQLEPSDWPRFRQAWQQRRRRRRHYGVAAVAALLLIMLLPAAWNPPPSPSDPANSLDRSALMPALSELQIESAQLEGLIRLTERSLVQNAAQASLSSQIIDRVQWIDATLAAAPPPDAQSALWQERVLLLRQLLLTQLPPPSLAASDATPSAVL